jgi:5-methylcytosine-specific restriction endonuclease McrA
VLRFEVDEWMRSKGCENKVGYLGWFCKDPLNSSLTIDHHDGDKLNSNEKNLKVLCANCHQKKTTLFGDNKKRYSYKNQLFSTFFEEA